MKNLLIMLLILTVMPAAVSAEIYTWTDSSGTVNFTEDYQSIPKKYQKNVIKRNESMAAEKKMPEKAEPARATAAAPSDSPRQKTEPAPAASGPGTARLADADYGGKKGSEWQAEFRRLRAKVADLDRQISKSNEDVKNIKGFVTRTMAAEINAKNAELAKNREKTVFEFNQLVEKATKAGLPSELSE